MPHVLPVNARGITDTFRSMRPFGVLGWTIALRVHPESCFLNIGVGIGGERRASIGCAGWTTLITLVANRTSIGRRKITLCVGWAVRCSIYAIGGSLPGTGLGPGLLVIGCPNDGSRRHRGAVGPVHTNVSRTQEEESWDNDNAFASIFFFDRLFSVTSSHTGLRTQPGRCAVRNLMIVEECPRHARGLCGSGSLQKCIMVMHGFHVADPYSSPSFFKYPHPLTFNSERPNFLRCVPVL